MSYTTDHTRLTSEAHCESNCRIGNTIWLVRRIDGFKFEMFTFNMNTKEFRKQTFKSEHLIEGDNQIDEKQNDFVITSANHKMYMWRQYSAFCRLAEFDPHTLTWSKLIDVQYDMWNTIGPGIRVMKNFFIADQNIYIMGNEEQSMDVMCMATFDIKTCNLPIESTKNRMCEMNGLIYVVLTAENGIRTVYQYDNQRNKFKKVTGNTGQRMDERIGGHCQLLCTSDNKVYQVMEPYETHHIIVDSFDMQTKEWSTTGHISAYSTFVQNVFVKDNHVFCVLDRPHLKIRVLDMKPSLETLSAVKVADSIVDNQLPTYLIKNMPEGMRDQLENMVKWKLKESAMKREMAEMRALINTN